MADYAQITHKKPYEMTKKNFKLEKYVPVMKNMK